MLGLLVLFFGAPFSVSGFVQYRIPGLPTSVIVLVTSAVLLIFHMMVVQRIRIDATAAMIVGGLFVPMFASFLILPINLISTDLDYGSYFGSKLWSRMINLSLFTLVFIAGYSTILVATSRQRRLLLHAYLSALGLFVFFGMWQWFSFYLGVPFPDFGSRTHIHSVSSDIRDLFPGRITSLATEPSFLAPLMTDALIVGAAVYGAGRRYFFTAMLPTLWVLLFSFSGGGYFNLLLLIGFGLLVAGWDAIGTQPRLRLIAAAGMAIIAALALHRQITQLMAPILGRMSAFFDLQSHDRLYMVVMPFSWFKDDGLLSALFGHGPGSFALLGEMYRLPDGDAIHITSNNLFSDVLYEQGVVGLLLSASVLITLVLIGLRRRKQSNLYLAGAFLAFNLIVTSIYRADFMAPRFWVVLLTICILYQMARTEAWVDPSRPLRSKYGTGDQLSGKLVGQATGPTSDGTLLR